MICINLDVFTDDFARDNVFYKFKSIKCPKIVGFSMFLYIFSRHFHNIPSLIHSNWHFMKEYKHEISKGTERRKQGVKKLRTEEGEEEVARWKNTWMERGREGRKVEEGER